MEKIKMTKKNIREVSRNLKNSIGNDEYYEFAVMYNPKEKKFFKIETQFIEQYKYEGMIFYALFAYYKADGKKPTIKEIERNIFNIN